MVYILLNAVHCLLKFVIVIVSALVVITQKYLTTFSNGSLTNARYLFPIPEGASVCAFKMELTNGSVVSGVVKDTEKAKKVFQDAVSQGEWAGLAYEITADGELTSSHNDSQKLQERRADLLVSVCNLCRRHPRRTRRHGQDHCKHILIT